MREIRPSGLEGGVALTPPSLPLSTGKRNAAFTRQSLPSVPSLMQPWETRALREPALQGIGLASGERQDKNRAGRKRFSLRNPRRQPIILGSKRLGAPGAPARRFFGKDEVGSKNLPCLCS